MKTILINKSTNQPVSGVFPDGYRVDGQRVSSDDLAKQGLKEVPYVDTPQPPLHQRQRAESHWELTDSGWERIWQKIELPPLINAQIRQLRQEAYLSESDQILMAIQGYERRGLDSAELETQWLAKIEEISQRYPYNIEEG